MLFVQTANRREGAKPMNNGEMLSKQPLIPTRLLT